MDIQIPGLELEETKPVRRGLTPGSIVLLAGIFAVIAVVGVQLMRRNQTQPYSGPAPDFSMPLYGGGSFTLSEQRGKIVVLNFWGSWCLECRDESPELQTIAEKYADQGVLIVGVNFRDTDRGALEFINEFKLSYLNGIDLGERITTDYHVTGAPESFVIDQNGTIQKFYWGGVTADELTRVLDQLLAGPTEASNS